MATISVLRETLRQDLGDLVALNREKRFENEQLESALFQGLQRHNRSLTWSTLPREEEQLILLLAKAKLAYDKALEYSLDPKMQSGQNLGRAKVDNADALMRVGARFEELYDDHRNQIFASTSESGDVLVGTLIRTSWFTKTKIPAQLATNPTKPVITYAEYQYDQEPVKQGRIRLFWNRLTDADIAYVRVYLSRKPVVELSDTVVKTFYDIFSSPSMPPTTLPIYPYPPFPQQTGDIVQTITPTGRWYLMMVAFNWNMLYTVGDVYALDVANYIDVTADSYVVPFLPTGAGTSSAGVAAVTSALTVTP